MMEIKIKNDNGNNVYALNIKEQIIHVSEAESGRMKYFCLGCEKPVEAVKSRIGNRIDYFRHIPQDVKNESSCTYRDETYRHKLAKDILQSIKKIKVPAVYKWPPNGAKGTANLIKEGEYIKAFSVGIERTFYEDETGEIKWGLNPKIDEKYLLIRPDVTFFDEEGKPILFIELVATHGVSAEKRAKLTRLGINCIQVRIPKESPQEIEASFSVVERTKWIFNYEESITEYIPISNSNSTGISPADEQQRKFFSESFNCRQAQINNLIRTIKRCLESKPYRDLESSIRGELSRVKRNTEEHQSRLDELRIHHRNRIEEKFRTQIEEFERRRSEYYKQEKEFREYSKNLEKRYYSKREELDREERFIDEGYKDEIRQLDGEGKSIEARKRDLDRAAFEVRGNIEREKSEIDGFGRLEEESKQQFENNSRETIREFETEEKLLISEENRIEVEIRKVSEEETEFDESIKREEDSIPKWVQSEERGIELEFEGLRKQIDDSIMQRSINGGTELSRRIRRLLEAREILINLPDKQRALKRVRTARECYKSRAYESWNKDRRFL